MLFKADQAVCIRLFDRIRATLRTSEYDNMGKMSNMTDGTKLSTDDEETPRVSSTLQSLLIMPKLM